MFYFSIENRFRYYMVKYKTYYCGSIKVHLLIIGRFADMFFLGPHYSQTVGPGSEFFESRRMVSTHVLTD